ERLTHALDEKETLLKEVYHRVKNNLQVVQSLLALQRRSVPEGPARAALDDSVQRVRAIALVHEKLYQSGSLASVSLPEYTRDLLFQIGEVAGQRHIAVRADIEIAHAGLDGAIPLGLLVAELVANAYKHGFRGRSEGEIHVVLRPAPDGAALSVSDDGVGLPEGFSLQGASGTMGLQLAASLARQLGGELQVHSGQGTCFSAILTRL
ncbi:MAG TPA: sensor histidine kinase, partial [Rhizobacter sp.]